MRISTGQIHQFGLDAILERQSRLSYTQNQVATGKRILTAADDPVAAAGIQSLDRVKQSNEQYRQNGITADARLNIEESVLSGVTELLHRVRELAVAANNASQTSETRRYMGVELRQHLDQLLAMANTKNHDNEYLFAGSKSSVKPFTRLSANNYQYDGDDNQRYLKIGDSRTVAINDSGNAVFMAARNGNGTFVTEATTTNTGTGVIDAGTVSGTFLPDDYVLRFVQALPTDSVTYQVVDNAGAGAVVAAGTYISGDAITFNGAVVAVTGTPADGDSFTISSSANQDIFSTLERFTEALENSDSTAAGLAQLNNQVGRTLTDVDQAMTNVLEVRAQIGTRLRGVEEMNDYNEAYGLQVGEALSALRDLDYAEAISRLNLQVIGLEAAQKSFARIQSLSLLNFL